jgi:hypothetical protein
MKKIMYFASASKTCNAGTSLALAYKHCWVTRNCNARTNVAPSSSFRNNYVTRSTGLLLRQAQEPLADGWSLVWGVIVAMQGVPGPLHLQPSSKEVILRRKSDSRPGKRHSGELANPGTHRKKDAALVRLTAETATSTRMLQRRAAHRRRRRWRWRGVCGSESAATLRRTAASVGPAHPKIAVRSWREPSPARSAARTPWDPRGRAGGGATARKPWAQHGPPSLSRRPAAVTVQPMVARPRPGAPIGPTDFAARAARARGHTHLPPRMGFWQPGLALGHGRGRSRGRTRGPGRGSEHRGRRQRLRGGDRADRWMQPRRGRGWCARGRDARPQGTRT